MYSQPLSDEAPRKPRLSWHHYLITAVVAYSLPWLATIVEMILTWSTQMHLAGHFGILFANPHVWLWMAIPAAITFAILLPFVRSTTGRWIASACLCLGWILFFLSNQVNTR